MISVMNAFKREAGLKPNILLLSVFSILLVSGCGTLKGSMKDIASWGTHLGYGGGHGGKTEPQSTDVTLRTDSGAVITPAPEAMTPQKAVRINKTSYNDSVEVFGIGGDSDYSNGIGAGQQVMPAYTGGVVSFDPSVTIFPLDGRAPRPSGGVTYSGGSSSGMAPMPSYNTSYGLASAGGGNQIFFKHGSSRLGGGDMNKLSFVAQTAKFAPVSRVTVAGYASQPTQAGSNTVKGHILNLKESMNRSFAVSKTLMRKGVPAEKIKTVSWGATKPTGNERQDRRVDIVMGEQ